MDISSWNSSLQAYGIHSCDTYKYYRYIYRIYYLYRDFNNIDTYILNLKGFVLAAI